MVIKALHDMGVRSEHAYLAALGSIGLSIVTWAGSLNAEQSAGVARADRWGIFVGEWAPPSSCSGSRSPGSSSRTGRCKKVCGTRTRRKRQRRRNTEGRPRPDGARRGADH
jgi:hypothetical protein